MEYLPILVVISLVLSLNVKEILTEGLSWSEANQHCEENGLEYDEGALKNSAIPDGEEFWFGMAIYRIRTPWIELLEFTNSNLSSDGTDKCTTIKCLHGITNITEADCSWDSPDIGGVCEYNNESIWNMPFKESLNHCMKNGQILLPSKICKDHPDMGILAWMNVFFAVMAVKLTICTTGNEVTREYVPTTQSDNDSTLGSIVGGICGAVVLVMASVVLIVCWKRKVGLFKKEKKVNHTTKFSNVTYDSSTVFTETNGSVKPTIQTRFEVSANNIKAEYAQVNKKSNMNPISHQADDTYAESSNGEYDRLNNIKNRKIQQNENTYDSNEGFRDQNDPTYDISTSGIRSDKDYDVYDHSFQTESSNSDYGYSTSGMVYCTDKK